MASRSIIVTGAASGMGLASAQAFAAAGDHVLLADTNASLGEQAAAQIAAAGGSAEFIATDVACEADVARLVATAIERCGTLDCYVNAAAILGEWAQLGQQQDSQLSRVLDINVKGTIFGLKHAANAMLEHQRGVIVNFASVQGFRVYKPGAAIYAASKAAVVSLTRSGALEYGAHGIRVVGIAPGPIDTPMLRSRAGNEPPAIVGETPLGRLGTATEVAHAVLWLCSEQASYITGATLPVDGGFLAP